MGGLDQKKWGVQSTTIAKDGNLSGVIDMRTVRRVVFITPAAWTAAYIGWKTAEGENATFVPLRDHAGSLCHTDVTTGQAYEAPPEIEGCHYVKAWSEDGNGSNAAQADARTLVLMLKS